MLEHQAEHAKEWRDRINTYFYRKSGITSEVSTFYTNLSKGLCSLTRSIYHVKLNIIYSYSYRNSLLGRCLYDLPLGCCYHTSEFFFESDSFLEFLNRLILLIVVLS
nr:hypothetical protein [Paenibacillus sp. IHB B 3084]